MSEKTPGDGTGSIITFAELQDKLFEISHDDHRWTAEAEYCSRRRGRRQVLAVRVWYTNPDLLDMPNQICFEFPAFPDEIWGSEDDALVCLHPSLITAVSEGLYWEEDELKLNGLEDFSRFWEPLREVLWRPNI